MSTNLNPSTETSRAKTKLVYVWPKKDSERRLQHRLKNARIAFAEIKNLHGYHKCVPEDEQQSWHNFGRN